MFFKNKTQINIKCACKNLIGPPPVYLLQPPPMPPLPVELNNIIIKNSNMFDNLVRCPRNLNNQYSNSTAILTYQNTNEKQAFSLQNFTMNSSYLFFIIITIIILIVFLVFFILFAFIIVYITRMKIRKTDVNNLNQSNMSKNSTNTSKPTSQQTVSVLSLTSPSLTQLTTSPNSTNSFNDNSEERNLVTVVDHQKLILNSFSKLPLNENSFKPIQNTILNNNNFNISSSPTSTSSTSSSSTSPNKRSIGNESIETNQTTSTFLTVKNLQRMNKYQSKLHGHQQGDQQHYYESIGDLSQLYFDVDDPSLNPNITKRNFLVRNQLQEALAKQNQIKLDFESHYPVTCCSCTLMRLNTNHQNLNNHSNTCLTSQQQQYQHQEQQLQFKLQNQIIYNNNNLNSNNFQNQSSSSNLTAEQYYLKSLLV